MAVFKKLSCRNGHVEQVAREVRNPQGCPKCGAPRSYSVKWYVSLRVNGDKYVKAVSPKKEDARAHQAEVQNQRDTGSIISKPGKYRFSDAVKAMKEWMDKRVEDGKLAKLSRERYLCSLNVHLIPFFQDYALSSIDHVVMDQYVESRKDHRPAPAPATINGEITAMKKLLAVCVRKGMLKSNPLAGYETLEENNERDRFLSVEEGMRLVEASKTTRSTVTYPAVLIGLHTGLRIDGVLGLRWSEIDFKAGRISKKVKGGKVVNIPLTKMLRAELLGMWQKRSKVTDYVFPGRSGRDRINISSRFGFREACRAAGIEDSVTFHTLRHTFATHFVMTTKDLHMLAGILGHSTTYITERYAHLCEERKAAAMTTYEEGTWQHQR